MASTLYQIAVDTHDLPALARFWCGVLDWKIVFESEKEIVIGADEHAFPGITFVPVPEGKTVKNRLHMDVTADDYEAEVERLLALGARRVDIGQENVPWTVLTDPEGNEFCVLKPKTSLST